MPVEPPPGQWGFGDVTEAADDLIGFGADLEPGTLLAAYGAGVFPMPLQDEGAVGWFSPVDRAVLPIRGMRVARSLRRSARRYHVTMDRCFADVVRGCADPSRKGGWIDGSIFAAYLRLHRLGWAHSIEAWGPDGELAGGLYGVAIGGLFCGESMFHRGRDASKVALMALVELLGDGEPDRLLDVQWQTPHLASLGVVEVGRAAYLEMLTKALALPLPAPWR